MSKSTPISVSRSRFVPLTIVTIVSVLCLALIFTLSSTAAGVLIAGWSFEGVTTTNTGQTPTVSVGSATADSGALTAGSAFTAFHTSTATVWSNPVGNGSSKSLSSNNWSVGDYYQFSFSTSGYSAIGITWDQTGSGTGPRDFKVQYSTNGTTFTNASGTNSTYTVTAQTSWSSSGSPQTAYRRTLDLSGVSAIENQSTVYIRLVDTSTTNINGTTVASAGTGRVDNFNVNGTATGSSTNPTGTGAANPSSVVAGGQSLLTVAVTPGTNPSSTGITVTANLTAIGGSSNQAFLDDGLNGDAVAGDNIFSFNSTVSNATTSGAKSLPFTVSDAQSRSSSGNISLTVTGASTNPTGAGTANPNSVLPGASTLLTVNVTPGTNPASTSLAVTADLSSIGGSAAQSFSGSGNTFTFTATVSNGTTPGSKSLPFTITDAQSRSGSGSISLTVQTPPPPANDVVISQIYGGGGNTGSTLKNDYIELINHSSAPVNLNGWSVQAYVNNDTTNVHEWQMTPLTNFTLQPGQYYLIQESQGAGGTDNLPTPDAIGTITVSSASTKVALVNNTTLITGACPASGVVDLVGYGTDPIVGTCHEGSGAAPELSNTIAIQRRNEGCYDTDDNAADFVIIAPTPHNTSSAVHDCTGLSAFGSANPSTIVQGGSTTLSVRVAPAQNPSSTGLSVTADLTSIGGSASQAFAAGSGNVFTYTALVPANNAPGMKSLPVTVTDAASRTANTNILLSILPIIADHVTISQIYGGGGNTNATYTNDYVELYNPTSATVSMAGWSLQYGPATNTTAFTGKTVIGGSIAPGAHYLISLASGGATGAQLPQPSVSGDINISATTGKIALVSNVDTLIGACPLGTDPDIVDFVGYGTANCHEGNANAPAPSNTTAIFRKSNAGPPTGDTDTDQNGNDFVTGAPNPRSESPAAEFGPSVAGTDPASNATTAPYDSSITVVFSEPVTVDSGWYNITCTVTGVHSSATEAHTSDLKTYAVTPNVSFQFGEQCTVTIPKTAIHDVDTDDGAPDTDTLAADYVWSFTVVGAGQPAPYPPSVHLTLGNPSGADTFQPLNYLMEKPTYALSYNRDKGTPNWVSWHLDSSWYGTLARVDVFRPDPKVDPTWYRVQDFDYTNSGFDRGHMTPNADRDNQNRVPINQETYLMSNIIPQAPDNNQGPWAALEAYLRTQSDAGNELYIVSGPNGVGGTGSNGSATTIANGHVTVPASTWKVALILPAAIGDDVARVTCSTRTIAVLMPNVQGIRNNDWHTYLTTIDSIEQLTGYDFFSNLPPAVQACIEAGTDGTNPPGTANQTASTTEDNSVTITLQALQSNANPLTFSITSSPTSGSLGSVSAATCSSGTCTATVTYTPTADFNGSDSFTFRANDGSVHSNTSTVTVGVSEVNDAPTATDDSKSTPEDTPLSFPSTDLTGNDSAGPTNESTQVLTVTSVTGGANTHGSVGLASGTVTYTPDANYNGAASFTYNVCDNGTTNGSLDTKCTTATVNVDVQSVNDNPTPVDDSATTDEDTPTTINVLMNDSDVDGDSLTVSAVTQGAHGSVTNNGSNVTYSPAANYNGSDSFTYTVSDGHGGTATASVSVTINSVNDAPVANNDSATTNEDTLVNIAVLGNDSDVDGDSLSVSAVTQGAHGSVTNNGSNVTYSPAANYNGGDSFSYTVSDGHGGTATATVSVTINSVNDNPVAVADSAATNEDNPVTIDVVANDTDVDGDSLSLASVGSAAHGSVSIVSGKAVYSPAANYNGNDSFGYVVSDGHGGQANGVVSVTVNPVNDAPTANGQSVNTLSNLPVAITLTGNDTETSSGNLTFTVTSGPSHGSLTGTGATRTYTPGFNYSGPDSFTFTVTDTGDGSSGPLTSNEATVSITVNDTVPPVITLNGNAISLWPLNKSMHTINVSDLVAGASDNFDPNVNLNSVVIASVSSDEGTAASGDVVIAGDCKSVQLKATRDGNGDGRVYTITFRARDAAGNTSFVTAKVTVPHDQGHGDAIDSGAAYTINSSCP